MHLLQTADTCSIWADLSLALFRHLEPFIIIVKWTSLYICIDSFYTKSSFSKKEFNFWLILNKAYLEKSI